MIALRHSVNVTRISMLLANEYKTNEDIDAIYRYLAQVEDFNKLTAKISKIEKQQLVRNLTVKYFEKGQKVFEKGEPVLGFFIVLSGTVEHHTFDKGMKIITSISSGKQIGDRSYMKQAFRSSDCISVTHSTLLCISTDTFKELLGEDAHMLLHKKLKFIENYFPGIKKYSFSHKERIAYLFEIYVFKRGTVVYKQGDFCDYVFFLCDGEIVLTNEVYRTPIIKLAPGSCFGEEVILGNKNSFTSVVSSEQAVLYCMKKAEILQYVPEETREAWRKNYSLKEKERRRLNFNVENRLNSANSTFRKNEFTMASPQAKKHLNFVTLRLRLSTSHKELRETEMFQDSKRILVQLRDSARVKRPVTGVLKDF